MEVRVKPAVLCAVIETCPGVPPVVALLNKIIEDAVQAVVATVTAPGDPDMAPEIPVDALDPVVIFSLLPAVPRTKLPLAAVIFPSVAVILVPAVTLVVATRAVPAVTVVPEAKDVVAVKDPGVVIAEGMDTVAIPLIVLTVICPDVPLI